jgi:hypothetical protein
MKQSKGGMMINREKLSAEQLLQLYSMFCAVLEQYCTDDEMKMHRSRMEIMAGAVKRRELRNDLLRVRRHLPEKRKRPVVQKPVSGIRYSVSSK